MSPLTLVGVACLAFVLAFTWRAATRAPGVGQSPRSAIIEAWFNIAIGMAISYAGNFFILPMVGAHMTPSNNLMIGWIYTAVSIVRQYCLRRWFNSRLHAVANRLAGDA